MEQDATKSLPGTSSSSILTKGFSDAGMSLLVLSAPDEPLAFVSVIEPVRDLGSSFTDTDLVLLPGLSGLDGGVGLASSVLTVVSLRSAEACFSDLAFFRLKKPVIPDAMLALK